MAKNGTDPVSDEPLSLDEFITVKTNNGLNSSSKPPSFSSIPSLLSIFQNEWDAIVLENFELKKKINQLQKDLANSVYHYDASIRVISRLAKERDEAVRKLQNTLISANKNGNAIQAQPEAMEVDTNGTEEVDTQQQQKQQQSMAEYSAEEQQTTDVLQPIKEADKFLNAIHQKQLKENKSTLNTTKHKLRLKSLFGFTLFEDLLVPARNQISHTSTILNNDLLLLSNCQNIFVLNLSLNSLINKIKITNIHKSSPLTYLSFINISDVATPNFKPIVGFEDGSTFIVDVDLSQKTAPTATSTKIPLITLPKQESQASIVTLLSHPSLNNHLIRIFANGIWALVNVNINKTIFTSTLDASANFEYSSADLHMDGCLLSIGTTNGLVIIYDLKTGDKLTTFQEDAGNDNNNNNDSVISNLVYANNGYWLLSTVTSTTAASPTPTSKVNIWDLRKGEISFTISSSAKKIIKKVSIDKFSQILTILFNDNTLEFYKYLKKAKQWSNDDALSTEFQTSVQHQQHESNKNNEFIAIPWQKTFERTFFVFKSDGKWGKFVIDFE